MYTHTQQTPLDNLHLAQPSRVMEQLADIEETIQRLELHCLDIIGIDLRDSAPAIIINRPEAPILTFPDGYTRVRPHPAAPLYGQARIGSCYIRWEEEAL